MVFSLAGLGGERQGQEQQQRHGEQTSHSAEKKTKHDDKKTQPERKHSVYICELASDHPALI